MCGYLFTCLLSTWSILISFFKVYFWCLSVCLVLIFVCSFLCFLLWLFVYLVLLYAFLSQNTTVTFLTVRFKQIVQTNKQIKLRNRFIFSAYKSYSKLYTCNRTRREIVMCRAHAREQTDSVRYRNVGTLRSVISPWYMTSIVVPDFPMINLLDVYGVWDRQSTEDSCYRVNFEKFYFLTA